MHHLVRMRSHLLWTSSFMCQQTVNKSAPTLKAAIAVLVSVVIDCLLMENPVQVRSQVRMEVLRSSEILKDPPPPLPSPPQQTCVGEISGARLCIQRTESPKGTPRNSWWGCAAYFSFFLTHLELKR